MFDTHRGQTLLHLARAAIAREFGFIADDLPRTDWLEQPGATFVTLTLNDHMRGCIGSLEAHRALIDDVRQNAVDAAFHDPRYAPLTMDEFADVVIDVALLSSPEVILFSSEADALEQLRPGMDGVTLEYRSDTVAAAIPGAHPSLSSATFLPHAWGELNDPQAYLSELKARAGLQKDFWSNDIRLTRFTVRKWREGGRRQSDHHG